MRLRTFLVLALSVAFAAADAQAAFLVSVGSASVAAGGSAFVDITIRGDPELPGLLDSFDARLQITGGPAGGLRFTAPQSNGQLTDSNYVFFGDTTGGPGAASTTTNPNDTYVGGDGTLRGNGADVTAGRLLLRLDLSALAAGVYTVSLTPTGTEFRDPDFVPVAFTATSGTVTVTGGPPPVVTPAPAGLLVGVAGAGLLGLARRPRRPARAAG